MSSFPSTTLPSQHRIRSDDLFSYFYLAVRGRRDDLAAALSAPRGRPSGGGGGGRGAARSAVIAPPRCRRINVSRYRAVERLPAYRDGGVSGTVRRRFCPRMCRESPRRVAETGVLSKHLFVWWRY